MVEISQNIMQTLWVAVALSAVLLFILQDEGTNKDVMNSIFKLCLVLAIISTAATAVIKIWHL